MNKKNETLSLLLCVSVFLPSMASAQDEASDDPGKEIIPAGVQDETRPSAMQLNDPAYREHDQDDVETKLMKEKIRAAFIEVGEKRKRVGEVEPVDFFFETEKRLIAALLEFHKEPAIVVSILEKNVETAKEIENDRRQRLEVGMGPPDDHALAIYFRADAELQLLRAKNKESDSRQKTTPAGNQAETRPRAVPINDQAYQENEKDDLETKLMKEKIRAAFLEIECKRNRFPAGRDNVLFEAEKRLIAALLEFHKEPAIVVSILEKNVETAKEIETNRKERLEVGSVQPHEHAQAICFRANAELQLLRAKDKESDSRQKTTPVGNQAQTRPGAMPLNDQAYREHEKDDLETKLMKEEIRAAFSEVKIKRIRVESGQDENFFLLEAEMRLTAPLLEFHNEPAMVISILEKNLEVATRIETNRRQRLESGVGRPDEHALAMYFRADAELQLLRAKHKNK